MMSSGGRAAHHFLNSAEVVLLSKLPIGSALHPFVKCGSLSFGQGMLGSSVPSLWTFVFGCCLEPAPLPCVIIRGLIHQMSGWFSSTVWMCIAKRNFDSLRAAITEGSPES